MFIRRTVASLLLAATLSAAPAIAAPPTTAFTYQGELKEHGQPVNASLPMTFRLFNLATGGTQLTEISKPSVAVQGGRFTEPLEFPAATMNGVHALWLEVVVNGVTLSERHQVTASPYSLATRGITVDAQNRVGIGTAVPSRKLSVHGGVDIYDASNEGVSIVTQNLAFADTNEDTFYRFMGATQRHVFSSNGAEWATIDGAGRVGIGTMSPTAPLHVQAPAGDASVKLPDSSIGPAELAAEPGVAFIRLQTISQLGSGVSSLPDPTILTRTINAPASGYLFIMGTGTATKGSTYYISVDGVETGAPDTVRPFTGIGGSGAVASSVRVVPVTAGAHTVVWRGYGDIAQIERPSLTVMYFPAAYGEVVP